MRFPISLPFLLDGAASSVLEIPDGARVPAWLCEHPAALEALQRGHLAAGAQALCAPTATAGVFQLRASGLEDRLEEINRRLVEICRKQGGVPVGGRLGPSGLLVPPAGEADFDSLYDGYRRQVRALCAAGADFLLLSGQTSLADLRAAVLAARTEDLPVLASLSVDGEGRTAGGCGLLPAAITLQAMGADAVGMDAPLTPEEMLPLLQELIPHASVPVLVKPAARRADGTLLSPGAFARGVHDLLCAGASLVGGSTGAGPEHIAALRRELDRFLPWNRGAAAAYEDADNFAAAIEREAFFLGDDIRFSEPMECSIGLGEDFIDLDDEQVNAALVKLSSMDDVAILQEFAPMSRLPLAVQAENPTILDAALRYFQGRLIVDSACGIPREVMEQMCAKYGGILY